MRPTESRGKIKKEMENLCNGTEQKSKRFHIKKFNFPTFSVAFSLLHHFWFVQLVFFSLPLFYSNLSLSVHFTVGEKRIWFRKLKKRRSFHCFIFAAFSRFEYCNFRQEQTSENKRRTKHENLWANERVNQINRN